MSGEKGTSNVNSRWNFSDIVSSVAGLIEKAIVSRPDRGTAPSIRSKAPTESHTEIQIESPENDQEAEEVFAVQKFFEKLNANNGNTLRPLQREADKEIGGVVYSTWNPLGEVSADHADVERYHQGKVLYSGILYKQGRRPNVWKERFFILRETGLSYFSHKDPFTIDLVMKTINQNPNSKENKEKIIHKNTIHLKRKELEEEEEDGKGLIKNLLKSPPKPRGNVFFVDVITPRGRVVEDLNWLSNALKGNKEHAFLIQTHDSMFALAARSKEDKFEWEKHISKVYDRFVQNMIRKVAIMELAWSFGEEVKFNTLKEIESKEEEEEKKELKKKKGGFFKRSTRRGSFFSTRRVKSKSKAKDTLNMVEGKKLKAQGADEKPPVAEVSPRLLLQRMLFRKTLEKTKKKMLKNVQEKKSDEDDERMKKQLKTAKKRARGSLNRMAQKDRVRISTKRMHLVLQDALEGLGNKYEEYIKQKRNERLLARTFMGWLYYLRLLKLSRRLNLKS